jgi:hypothetical protein
MGLAGSDTTLDPVPDWQWLEGMNVVSVVTVNKKAPLLLQERGHPKNRF